MKKSCAFLMLAGLLAGGLLSPAMAEVTPIPQSQEKAEGFSAEDTSHRQGTVETVIADKNQLQAESLKAKPGISDAEREEALQHLGAPATRFEWVDGATTGNSSWMKYAYFNGDKVVGYKTVQTIHLIQGNSTETHVSWTSAAGNSFGQDASVTIIDKPIDGRIDPPASSAPPKSASVALQVVKGPIDRRIDPPQVIDTRFMNAAGHRLEDDDDDEF